MRRIVAVFAVTFACAAFAAETPHEAWLKAKCAVCHGEDGSGNTPEGKRRNAPDLRAPAIQKHTDAELYDMIVSGHAKMPSFKGQLTKERAALLVTYIRSLKR